MMPRVAGTQADVGASGRVSAPRTPRRPAWRLYLQHYELLADRTHLLLQLQGFAACRDTEVLDTVRGSFAALWHVVTHYRARPGRCERVPRIRVLLNSDAALVELFAHITTETNRSARRPHTAAQRGLGPAIVTVACRGAVFGEVGAPLVTSVALSLDVPLDAAQR